MLRPDVETKDNPSSHHSGKPTDSTPSKNNLWNTEARTFFISPEGYKKYCEGCTHLKSAEQKRKLMVVTCTRPRCIYIEQNEIWESLRNEST